MAPTQAERTSIRAQSAKSGSGALEPRPPSFGYPILDNGFSSSKKDRRTIKHASFISKVEKTHAKPTKRRRSSKKLVANLESLADALPNTSETQTRDTITGDIKIRHRSLRSRPGAMKRKEKLEKLERERFGKNMAQMRGLSSTDGTSDTAQSTTWNRWAALRGFIAQTMEKKDEFQDIDAA
ncbi:MAG: hypothetical protein M1836_004645 [Candelina mexicana]|nr:MAG: hypothetical protein M1836_004645 [Candelina mexicana]